jgi:isopropylmalate/homocitrate/citramalate synthase
MSVTLPPAVRIREVGPRDGFQNEPEVIPNERGLDHALALRGHFDEINVFLSASEAHNRHNVNRSVEESLAGLERVLPRARAAGLRCEAVISGQGLANVFAALQAGVDSFESSFGELGGCPFPPGATGNVTTEDLVSMLHESGVQTGIDLPALVWCSRAVREQLGRPLGSHTLLAGPVDWHR